MYVRAREHVCVCVCVCFSFSMLLVHLFIIMLWVTYSFCNMDCNPKAKRFRKS